MRLSCIVVVAAVVLAAMSSEVSAVRYIVGGGGIGWTTNPKVNYTVWAQDKKFYTDDWLFFVYDRNQLSVLEVNKTSYDTCDSSHFLHNYTTGAGRDVVALNVSRHYYFISGNGACFGGVKLALHVEKHHPPPPASAQENGAFKLNLKGKFVIPTLFAIASVWDSLLR